MGCSYIIMLILAQSRCTVPVLGWIPLRGTGTGIVSKSTGLFPYSFLKRNLNDTKAPFSHSRSEPRPGRCSAYDQNLCFEYDIMQILFIF